MNQLVLFFTLIFILLFKIEAQSQAPPPLIADDKSPRMTASSFRPSVAVVVGVLSIMFSLTFLLLIYAKFCHNTAPDLLHRHNFNQHPTGLVRSTSRFSGIDKTVIESLPFFRFSSLKGSREGLECAVCLSKFEEIETLRLLPKCKHAFHVNCVDQWLENHSSCPLCRLKVDVEDLTVFAYSSSMRFSRTQSNLSQDPNIELFVRREAEDLGSSRFSVGSSFRQIENVIPEVPSIQESASIYSDEDGNKILDKSAHIIKVSDVGFKSRWSDVGSADLLFLNSVVLNNAASNKVSSSNSPNGPYTINERAMKLKEDMDKKRLFESKVNRIERSHSVTGSSLPSTSKSEWNVSNTSRFLIPAEKRSMSEIVNFSRFVDHYGLKNRLRDSPDVNITREEKMRKLWSPIARRTVVEWFAGRERSKQSQYSRQLSIV
ncbi:hypothetical protein IFM89_007453 [Coptis chinensis]|uniref:RING-type E3 ubiquitin transferase n=1 Tax=Coptis chinensis TaxID=261450 RepID=A0A835LZJ4_9MAGN|nr:hypothetical protein IFM89_007453 [Coptis chinensis]